jgi:hypothetical protein
VLRVHVATTPLGVLTHHQGKFTAGLGARISCGFFDMLRLVHFVLQRCLAECRRPESRMDALSLLHVIVTVRHDIGVAAHVIADASGRPINRVIHMACSGTDAQAIAACKHHDDTAARSGSVDRQWRQRHFDFAHNVTETRQSREDAVLRVRSSLAAKCASKLRDCDFHRMSKRLLVEALTPYATAALSDESFSGRVLPRMMSVRA